MNTKKNHFCMIFHRSNIKPNVINKVVIDDHQLTQVNSAKYIGVIIDHKLNWIEHISYVKSKMSKGIGIMYKTRQLLTKKALLMLYHAYIYPYMTYCIEVWVLCFSNSTQLFIVASKENHKNNELLLLFSTYQSTFLFNGIFSFREYVFV